MPKTLFQGYSMSYPSISPDGTRVLGGNGKLQVVDLLLSRIHKIQFSGSGFLRGGWADNATVLIQNDDADGWIYKYTGGIVSKYKEGNYKGNQFRVSQSFNWLRCVDGKKLTYNDLELGDKNFSVDLSGRNAVANHTENNVSFLRVWKNGNAVKDYKPITAPHIVRASANDYYSFGYSGTSGLLLPDGSQVVINLVPKEGPCKVIFDSKNSPWVVSSADNETYLRPLGHKEKTAIILESGSVRLDAWSSGDKVIVACDLTNGLCTVFEASFKEKLVPIDNEPEPPEPPDMIPNHLNVVQAAREKYSNKTGKERAGLIVNQVAWDLRNEGAGTFFKNSGDNYNDRSLDVIIYKKSSVAEGGETFDILGDAEGSATPQWGRTKPSGFGDIAKWRAATDPGSSNPNPPDPPSDPARDLLKSIRSQIDEFFGE